MKTLKRSTIVLFTFLLALAGSLATQKAQATHCAGGELTYVWVQDSTYKFTFKFYRDCSGSSSVGPFTLCYYSDCGGSGSVSMAQVSGPTQVVVPCNNTQTTCQSAGSVNPNYQEYVFEGTVVGLSRCSAWRFFTYLGSRNTSDNITGSSGYDFYVEAVMNNQAAQGNSSPQFTVRPVPFACVNIPYTFNNGASDPNNDSLSYELIMPRGTTGTSCASRNVPNLSFSSPSFNLTNNPFSTNNTFTLSPVNGQLAFTANQVSANLVTLLVKEWRNGVNIGSVIRDIQVRVKSSGCSQQPSVVPQQASSIGVNFAPSPYQACAGQSFTLCTRITTPDTAAWLAVNSNNTQIAPGSVMNYTGTGTDTVMACLTWTPSPTDTGLRTFTYTVRDTNCASNGGVASSQTFSVSMYINPLTVASHDTTICYGTSATVSVFGGYGFHWSVLPGGSPASSIACDTCKITTVSPTATTRYLVTSSGTSFCSGNRDTVTVTIAPIPTFNAGPDTTTCINNSLQLNANVALPAGTYSVRWTPATYLSNDTVVNPVVRPTNDISYVIRVTPGSAGACALYDTLRVNVVRGYDLLTPDTAICKGASVAVRVSGDNRYTYAWTPGQGVSAPGASSPLITPDTSRRYTLTASFPGCRDSVRSLFIDVQPIPTVYIGADRTLCYGDTIHMDVADVQPAAYPNYSYSWTPGGNFDFPFRLHPVFTGLGDTHLTLTATTPAGCSGSASVDYRVIPANFLTLSADTAICPGDTVQLLVGGTFRSLSWVTNTFISDTSVANPRVWPVTSTGYTVIGTDANACLDTATVQVTVHPRALVSLPDSVTIYPGESYAINPGGNCLYFQWFPPAGLSNAGIANPVASPEVDTRYFVTARAETGCVTRDSMDVRVSLDSYIDVPNAFSPGSQPNSELRIVHRGTVSVQKFRIYNRWGAQMFSTTDVNQGWDGTLGGVPQPMGVYVYIVEASTPTGRHFQKQGNITLIR